MSANDPKSPADLDAWREAAAKELKGADPDSLVWNTPEGIPVKPIYSAADLEDLEYVDTLPGFFPYVRGPYATGVATSRLASRDFVPPRCCRSARA